MEIITCFIAHGSCARSTEVKKSEGICFECRRKMPILIFDNSDHEYTPMNFCIDCLKEFLNGKISKSVWEIDVSIL